MKAILFDLGNTLASYYTRDEFPPILRQSILEVRSELQQLGLLRLDSESMWQAVQEENYESSDYRVRPLVGRLTRIFALEPTQALELGPQLCRAFLKPIMARSALYPDTLPTLHELRHRGLRLGIVSNAPWGSPAEPWHAELARLGLNACVDDALFCSEAGWRKPARPIFELALRRLGVGVPDALFVGDDPRWDLAGPRALGMEARLIVRAGEPPASETGAIRTLAELLA